MSSLQERIDILEKDLLANPPRISASHDLPFAICRYDPSTEFDARKQISLFAIRLQNAGKKGTYHLGRPHAVDRYMRHRRDRGDRRRGATVRVSRAQETVSTLLSDDAFKPLPDAIAQCILSMHLAVDVVFLVRVAAIAPAIYRSAKLLDAMHGRTSVPIILFYPSTLDGEHSLRFMRLSEREQTGAYNYRVKIY